MKQSTAPSKASFLASYLIIAILVVLPFYTLLSVWASSNFGHLNALRVFKELLLLPLGAYAAILVVKNKPLLQRWAGSWLVRLILAYGLFTMAYGLTLVARHSVATPAVLQGLILNLRFLWLFMVVWAVSYANPLIRNQWAKIVLIPASLAVSFGLLQRLVLPMDFLKHFGYGPSTIDAVETVDQKLGYQRIQSGLRGANPFGAYLVVVLTAAVAYVKRHAYLWLLIAAGLLALFFTYSRSAWIGVVVSLACYGWLTVSNRRARRQMLVIATVLVLLFGMATWVLRNNDLVQNSLFHADETSQAVSSNSQRANALNQGLREVAQEPLGRGPGTAGPASVRNNGQVRIAENYFLQIGQELGWLGLSLFVAINALVAWELWRRTTTLAKVLLATLVGITVVNLISHAWADDALSLLWWGLAGAAIMNKE